MANVAPGEGIPDKASQEGSTTKFHSSMIGALIVATVKEFLEGKGFSQKCPIIMLFV